MHRLVPERRVLCMTAVYKLCLGWRRGLIEILQTSSRARFHAQQRHYALTLLNFDL